MALSAKMLFSCFEIFSAVVGLCIGSFANVVIHRLPKGKSIILPSSSCPDCKSRLKGRDMIPAISWLILRGRCRHCKAVISWRYPIIEAGSAILFVLMARYTGVDIAVLPLWCLVFVLLCVAAIDLETMKIPDSLLVIGTLAGLIWVGLFGYTLGWLDALLGVATGALPLLVLDWLVWMVVKKPGFGFGDVKLMAMAGLFLGWQGVIAAYFIAFVAGGLYGAGLLIMGKAERGSYLAFGPFLCLGITMSFLTDIAQNFFY